jgi:HNH endonuclease
MSEPSASRKLCDCGCGEPAPVAVRTRRAIGHVKGEPLRFISGHQGRGLGVERRARAAAELATLEVTGLCECGCGLATPIAKVTNRKRGYIKGQPQRFVKGHSATRKERKPCAAPGCERTATAQYCKKHAECVRIHGDLVGKRPKGDEEFRFWFRVDKTGDCWTWTGGKSRNGYGAFWTKEKRLVRASRFSYEQHYGPIPNGMVVCHRCDNPPCVRPDHLFLGTQSDNMRDMWQKGRRS